MTDIEQATRAEAERRWLSSRRQRDFVAGASWLAEYLLSDEAVERGLKASREFPMKRGLDNSRNVMRAVLSAALGTNHTNGSER